MNSSLTPRNLRRLPLFFVCILATGALSARLVSEAPAPTPEFGSVSSLGGLLAADAAGMWLKRRLTARA